jgi:hypothetical protein
MRQAEEADMKTVTLQLSSCTVTVFIPLFLLFSHMSILQLSRPHLQSYLTAPTEIGKHKHVCTTPLLLVVSDT